MTRLHINIDHVATLRQQRDTMYPDPVAAAVLAELAGADGITVHLREDRRHIQKRDVEILRKMVGTVLNLEMAATEEMLEIAESVRPDVCTLVPEKREEKTTEGGLDVAGDEARLSKYIAKLSDSGARISLFIDPSAEQVHASARVGAQMVELHTGDYCEARGVEKERQLARLQKAATLAGEERLEVAAGHGLSYTDVGPVAAIEEVEELNIGHGVISRAVLVGLERAVMEMQEAMERGV